MLDNVLTPVYVGCLKQLVEVYFDVTWRLNPYFLLLADVSLFFFFLQQLPSWRLI